MQLSEFIVKLTTILQEHGDLPLYTTEELQTDCECLEFSVPYSSEPRCSRAVLSMEGQLPDRVEI